MKKVLLVSMPFGALERPALGISLLKAGLAELNIPCDIRYLGFTFAELIGFEEYQWMSFDLPYTAFAGDWTFAHALNGEDSQLEMRYIQDVLQKTWRLDDDALKRILHIRSLVSYFLEYCMTTVPWEEYSIVGFTSTFEQNIASLALAKRLKATYPDTTTAFGGANWEGEMGFELHKQFSFVDYVCSGEADESFPELTQRLLRKKPIDEPVIPGIVYRKTGESVYTGQAGLISDLNKLSYPDFSDYFKELSHSSIASSVVPILLLETSRGCWWGQKSHCTFCGLNGETMAFRSKSPERVIAELEYLVGEWQLDFIELVDNIIGMKFFDTLLPALADAGQPAQIFCEIKANLKRKHVKLMSEAGITNVQPGIESLSDHVLNLMGKGTTALRNIQLLKWCKEYDIFADWNLLYGFPGETREDYDVIMKHLPSIRFLGAPTGYGPIRLDRFSPYHFAPEEYGIINVRPLQPYNYFYLFNDEILNRIAYYFDYDYADEVNPAGHAQQVVEYVRAWQQQPEMGTLFSEARLDGELVLTDTRSNAVRSELKLFGWQRAVYEYCDEMHTSASIIKYLHEVFADARITDQQIVEFLKFLVYNMFMVTDGKYYLSLAIPLHSVQELPLEAHSLVGVQMQKGISAG